MIIGFLGAGQMAQTLARVWLPAGHQVLLANSRGPDSLAGLVAELGPAARAVTPPELTTADVVVLATRWVQTPDAVALVGPLTGTIVLDPTNNRVGPRPVMLAEGSAQHAPEANGGILYRARQPGTLAFCGPRVTPTFAEFSRPRDFARWPCQRSPKESHPGSPIWSQWST